MSTLTHILKYKLLTLIKFQEAFSTRSIIKNIGSSAVYFLFAAGIYIFTKNILSYLIDDVKIGLYLLHRFFFVVLFLLFMTVNIGNMVVSYSTFFKNDEVGFLLTKPISFTKIFLIKFLDNFFYSSSTLLLMVTASLTGYVSYFGLPWYFIPITVVFLILPFLLIAGTLGAVTLLSIMMLASKFGLKKILVTVAILYGVFIILFYTFSSPVQLVTNVFKYFPNLDSNFGFLESPLIKLLPNHWVADAFYWISAGKFVAAGWNFYLLIVFAFLFVMFALLLARKWFYKSWLIFLTVSNELSIKKKMSWKSFFSFEKKSSLNPGNEALLKRELLLFIRDPSQWTHFLVMIFLIVIFILSISSIDISFLNTFNTYLKTMIYLIIYLFNVFLIATMSLRFIFPLVSLEGETIWKIKSSPLNNKKVMLTRLSIYFLVIFCIGQLLNFVSNYQFPAVILIISQLNTALVTTTLVSFNFGMGSLYANFKEKNPIRVASSQGASLTFLFTIIFLVFLTLLLFTPLSNYFLKFDNFHSASVSQLLTTIVMLAIITIIISYLSITTGIKNFVRDI